MKRTNMNGDLSLKNVGKNVCLCGWVSKKRNLGSLVFIDLRDRSGIIQLVFQENFKEIVSEIRNEYVIAVKGIVCERKDKNLKLKTGEIEIDVQEISVINSANTTPLIIADETDALEETRLRYRYLDLRRPVLQNNLMQRHRLALLIRNFLSKEGFIEIETPILCKSTPEGARDYLVPSRIYPGNFYALPQSPQIYKQLLMIAGLDRYFQIAHCFRDEDLRADRQPEFSQIDIEMSFVEEEDVLQMVEKLMKHIFYELKGIHLSEFKRLPYDECMELYGSDKPDLRFGMQLHDITSMLIETIHPLLQESIKNKGCIKGLKVENQTTIFSRKKIDQLQEFIQIYGVKNLLYVKYNDNEFSGSIAKTLSKVEKQALIQEFNLQNGDMVFIVTGKKQTVQTALGALRHKLGEELNLKNHKEYQFLWITDFPMFEYSEEEKRYVAAHHPFTAPKVDDLSLLTTNPSACYSKAYDLVLNGYELLSGSIRIHQSDVQQKVFEAIGLSFEEAKQKFGFFLDAFQYGTPPHGGVGIGFERLLMILQSTENIKDVVAFPKTASASDLMSQSPNEVDMKQLDELGISLK